LLRIEVFYQADAEDQIGLERQVQREHALVVQAENAGARRPLGQQPEAVFVCIDDIVGTRSDGGQDPVEEAAVCASNLDDGETVLAGGETPDRVDQDCAGISAC